LTGGIEIIQAHHRYVVCWPSVHPEGRTYEWVNEATGAAEIPPIESLPYLPAAWIDRLTAANTAHHKADVDGDDIREFLEALPDGDPCQHIQRAAGIALSGSSRHDAYNHATLAVLSRGRQGGACIDDYMAELALNEEPREGTADATGATQDDEPATGAQDDTNPPSDAYERAVRMEASKLKLRDDAKQMLARYKAGQAPAIDGIDLGTFLSQPDEVIAYRVDRLWPSNGRVLLAAAAKAGKTTMMTNLLACLADGGQFLGVYTVEPIAQGRTVVYINLEVGQSQMRRWLRRTGVVNVDRIHVVNLRGQASALTLASEDGRKRIADYLRRHGHPRPAGAATGNPRTRREQQHRRCHLLQLVGRNAAHRRRRRRPRMPPRRPQSGPLTGRLTAHGRTRRTVDDHPRQGRRRRRGRRLRRQRTPLLQGHRPRRGGARGADRVRPRHRNGYSR
jgi:hypothetical protein